MWGKDRDGAEDPFVAPRIPEGSIQSKSTFRSFRNGATWNSNPPCWSERRASDRSSPLQVYRLVAVPWFARNTSEPCPVERSRRAVFPRVLDTVFHKTPRMRTPRTKMTTFRMPFMMWLSGDVNDPRVFAVLAPYAITLCFVETIWFPLDTFLSETYGKVSPRVRNAPKRNSLKSRVHMMVQLLRYPLSSLRGLRT